VRRRGLLLPAALAAGLLLLAISAPGALAKPRATVRLADCATGLAPGQRLLTVTAQARLRPRALRTLVRFTLQQRPIGGGSWTALHADGFDTWLSSDAGVRRFLYDKTVHSLVAGARYRVVVRFKWVSAAGAVVGRAKATSATCAQPDLRPDLHPTGLVVRPGPDAGHATYAVGVRNAGGSAGAPFDVALEIAGAPGPVVRQPALGAHRRRTVTIAAAACPPGQTVAVRVDPLGRVDEADETDNVLVALCPPSNG
jgi:hypothetical protein